MHIENYFYMYNMSYDLYKSCLFPARSYLILIDLNVSILRAALVTLYSTEPASRTFGKRDHVKDLLPSRTLSLTERCR